MSWFYLIVLVVVVGLLWRSRSRRQASRGLLSPSELGEVLGRSRDAVHHPPAPDGGAPDPPTREPRSDQ
jgi:hypothetical protein